MFISTVHSPDVNCISLSLQAVMNHPQEIPTDQEARRERQLLFKLDRVILPLTALLYLAAL